MKTKRGLATILIIVIIAIAAVAVATTIYLASSGKAVSKPASTSAECGNGVVDAGEECDISGCDKPALCADDCVCVVPRSDDDIPKPPALPN